MLSDATMIRTRPLRPVAKIVGFAVLAFVVTAVAGGVWTALLATNLATSPATPWPVVAMALLLWGLWGAGWPRSTSATRPASLAPRNSDPAPCVRMGGGGGAAGRGCARGLLNRALSRCRHGSACAARLLGVSAGDGGACAGDVLIGQRSGGGGGLSRQRAGHP